MACSSCRERRNKTHCCICGRKKEQPPFNAKPGDYVWTKWGKKIICWECLDKHKEKVK